MLYYLYDDINITMNDWFSHLDNVQYDLDQKLYNLLKDHRNRTQNPNEAKLFILGAPFRKSYFNDKINHKENVRRCFEKLFKNKYFNRLKGVDHLFLGAHWNFCAWAEMRNDIIDPKYWLRLENMISTRYEYYRMSKWENMLKSHPKLAIPRSMFSFNWESTKKSIIVPYGKWKDYITLIESNYEEWKNRKYFIFYHTRKWGSMHGGTLLRHLPIKNKKLFVDDSHPGSIGFDLPQNEWLSRFKNSKFGLVIRGDTYGSHSFINCISFGCIPVIISDLFNLVSMPFNNMIKLSDFCVEIKEKDYLDNPSIVLDRLNRLSELEIQNKIEKMREVRPMLLYHHPRCKIVDLVLNELNYHLPKRGGRSKSSNKKSKKRRKRDIKSRKKVNLR